MSPTNSLPQSLFACFLHARGCKRAGLEPQESMFQDLQSVLLEMVSGPAQSRAHHADLRRLLGRADLTEREVRILRGVARQIRWARASNRSRESTAPGASRGIPVQLTCPPQACGSIVFVDPVSRRSLMSSCSDGIEREMALPLPSIPSAPEAHLRPQGRGGMLGPLPPRGGELGRGGKCGRELLFPR